VAGARPTGWWLSPRISVADYGQAGRAQIEAARELAQRQTQMRRRRHAGLFQQGLQAVPMAGRLAKHDQLPPFGRQLLPGGGVSRDLR